MNFNHLRQLFSSNKDRPNQNQFFGNHFIGFRISLNPQPFVSALRPLEVTCSGQTFAFRS